MAANNESKRLDPRMWERWKKAGALSNISDTKLKPANPEKVHSEASMGLVEKPIDLVDFLLRERLIWDQPTDESVHALIKKLTQQVPNRVYFAPDGKMVMVLLYTEPKTLYHGYMESVQFKGNLPSTLKGEFLSCRGTNDLELEVRRFRSRYDAMGDLLEQPSRVFQYPGSREQEFTHVGEGEGLEVFYRYYISALGIPRTVSMGLVTSDTLAGAELISRPPLEIFKQTHPYNSVNK